MNHSDPEILEPSKMNTPPSKKVDPQQKELIDRMNQDIDFRKENRDWIMKEFSMKDEDGSPSDACLEIIENWHWSDPEGWFGFIKEYWWFPEFGWEEDDEPHEFKKDKIVHRIYLSTGGWSGNESIIYAMGKNKMMWSLNWVQSRRGGHYIFEIHTPQMTELF